MHTIQIDDGHNNMCTPWNGDQFVSVVALLVVRHDREDAEAVRPR